MKKTKISVVIGFIVALGSQAGFAGGAGAIAGASLAPTSGTMSMQTAAASQASPLIGAALAPNAGLVMSPSISAAAPAVKKPPVVSGGVTKVSASRLPASQSVSVAPVRPGRAYGGQSLQNAGD